VGVVGLRPHGLDPVHRIAEDGYDDRRVSVLKLVLPEPVLAARVLVSYLGRINTNKNTTQFRTWPHSICMIHSKNYDNLVFPLTWILSPKLLEVISDPIGPAVPLTEQ